MPARTLIPVAAVALVAVLLTGSAILAQESPAPAESPAAVASPMPAVSEAPATGASPDASAAVGMVVPVTLQEVAVIPESTTIPAGSVTLEATNMGPALQHELVVVRTDLPASGLPTLEDGSFDESAEGVEVLGEIEELEPGQSASITLDLPLGHYVFLCNVVSDQDGVPFSHYNAGMYVDVEVVGATESPAADATMAAGSPAASMAPAPSAPAASPAA